MRFQVILLIAIGVLVVLTAWPLLLGQTYVYGDLGALQMPYRDFISQQMRLGIFPLWDPLPFGGLYVHGEGQMAMAHPFHLLTYPLLPTQFLIGLEVVLWYLALFAGGYLLFRRWDVSRPAALFGAMALAYSGFARPHLPHTNFMAVLAHIPWMLLCLDSLCRSSFRSYRLLLYLALLNLSAVLFAYPPLYFFSLVFQAWYLLLFRDQSRWLRLSVAVAVCIVLAVIAAAPQILPTLTSIKGSVRSGANADFILAGSWSPLNVLGSANPMLYPNGYYGDPLLPDESRINPGLGVLLLAGAGAIGAQNSRLRWGLLALLAVSVFFALGRRNPFIFLVLRLPVIREFRIPTRYLCFASFALSGLAAFGFDAILAGRLRLNRKAQLLTLVSALLAVVTCGFAWAVARAPQGAETFRLGKQFYLNEFSAPDRIVAGAAAGLILCALFWLTNRIGGIWTAVFASAACLEICVLAGALWLSYPVGTRADVMAEVVHPQVPPPAMIGAPFYDRNWDPKEGPKRLYIRSWHTNIYNLLGYRTTTGYTGLAPRTTLPLESTLTHELFGAQSIWVPDEGWVKVEDPLPGARLLAQAVPSSEIAADMRKIDYRRQALVSEPLHLDRAATGRVTSLQEVSSQARTVQTESSGAMLCVLNQRYHSGWRAKMDGSEVKLIPVYGDLTGFVVPAGTHTTELRFDPVDFRLGLMVFAAITALVGLLALGRRQIARWLSPAPVIQSTHAASFGSSGDSGGR